MLKDIFTPELIQHYKSNKSEITSELLESLRQHGNEGKQLALELLDLEKSIEGHYKDAFGNKISYNGIITLKSSNTKINISKIHEDEITRCSDDVHYFMKNYCKIVTKSGVNFPELRKYQISYLDSMVNEEATVSLQSRQSGKSVVAAVYLLWLSVFHRDILIGIAANKNSSAKEILDKIKKIFMNLPIWLMPGLNAWNKTFIELDNGIKILTDSTNGDSFRGFSVNCLYLDEVSWVKASMWEEFSDSVFPTQGALAWKKTILTSTMKGMNHWYNIVQKAKNTDEYNYHEAKWYDVPRYDKQGNIISPEVFMESVINKHGLLYWNQNYLNEAIGSSHTLLQADTLKRLESRNPEEIWDNKLKIYHKPEKGHNYILTVDPSKDGIDAFAVQVTDITDFRFKQAASAKLQIDYLLMPEFLDEWGRKYNNALIIIENNEGAGQSIADQLYQTYEYENLYFDKDSKDKKRKKYPGFRTTTKSRKLILNTLKTFIENDNLEISDFDTISEFFTFILINNKYQADESCHDDMVMSLALTFGIFCNTKNFEDMKQIVSGIFGGISPEDKESENDNFVKFLTIGSFDDGVAENESYLIQKSSKYSSYEDVLLESDGFI